MQEIWKDIYFINDGKVFDYRGQYQVSNHGNVKSLYRIDNNNHVVKEKYMTQRTNNGYKIVTLTKNNIHKDFKVHRLVAYMFIENPNNYPIINHKNENKADNNVNNLEWCTYKYNANYGCKNYKIAKRINQYDLNNNYIKTWNSISDVKREYGYDVSCIVKCCRNKKKNMYGYKWSYVD